jgi:hypothetical protein
VSSSAAIEPDAPAVAVDVLCDAERLVVSHNDHRPSRFSASYGNYEVTVGTGTGVVDGIFPKRALSLVREWYEIHKADLLEDWTLAGVDLRQLERIIDA